MLSKYRWPGNIRQLKNVAEKISVMETGDVIDPMDRCVIGPETLAKYLPKEEYGLASKSKLKDLNKESDDIASKIIYDIAITDVVDNMYSLRSVATAKDLKDKFKLMVGTMMKDASTISKLEAENIQIDNTIKTLESEQEKRGIAYDKNGNLKSESDIVSAVMSDNNNRKKVHNKCSVFESSPKSFHTPIPCSDTPNPLFFQPL